MLLTDAIDILQRRPIDAECVAGPLERCLKNHPAVELEGDKYVLTGDPDECGIWTVMAGDDVYCETASRETVEHFSDTGITVLKGPADEAVDASV